MDSCLQIEYFDTDASSYTHRLNLPLKNSNSFRVGEANILQVEHADGSTHFVPLSNVRQYYCMNSGDSNEPQNPALES